MAHSARLGIRFFTDPDQLPEVLKTLREEAAAANLALKEMEFTAKGTFNADKDGGSGADASLKMDIQTIAASAPLAAGAALKASYDNQGLVELNLRARYGAA